MLPPRLGPLLRGDAPPAWDAALSYDELVTLLDLLTGAELEPALEERLLAYLEANLPGGEVAQLIAWPGEWFGNRWYEEAELSPAELAGHLLERSERELD